MQPQIHFIFLQFKVYSDTNTLELSNKINHVNTNVKRVYTFMKKVYM